MVTWCVIVGLVVLAVGILIGRSSTNFCRFNDLSILLKENRQLKEELAKKTEQIQYWEATPETTVTG